jgi:CheY-like chemotaxis protein
MESTREFPFQTDDSPEVSQLSSCPGLSTNLKLEKPERHEHGLVSGIAPDMSQESAPIQSMTSTTPLAKDRPALLIVDDNCINLTLLRTFLRKLKFELVQESENGLDAVKRVQERIDKGEKSYDIIFMDINMPVMDGFEATRRIRALELLESHPSSAGLAAADIPSMAEGGVRANKTTRSCLTKNNMAQQPKFSPRAFIVALTGLASREDQSDAYKSGIDLFLTKPVSFKEIRKILNNWYTVNGN